MYKLTMTLISHYIRWQHTNVCHGRTKPPSNRSLGLIVLLFFVIRYQSCRQSSFPNRKIECQKSSAIDFFLLKTLHFWRHQNVTLLRYYRDCETDSLLGIAISSCQTYVRSRSVTEKVVTQSRRPVVFSVSKWLKLTKFDFFYLTLCLEKQLCNEKTYKTQEKRTFSVEMSTFVRLEIGSVYNDHWPTMKFPELRCRQITEISSAKPGSGCFNVGQRYPPDKSLSSG